MNWPYSMSGNAACRVSTAAAGSLRFKESCARMYLGVAVVLVKILRHGRGPCRIADHRLGKRGFYLNGLAGRIQSQAGSRYLSAVTSTLFRNPRGPCRPTDSGGIVLSIRPPIRVS